MVASEACSDLSVCWDTRVNARSWKRERAGMLRLGQGKQMPYQHTGRIRCSTPRTPVARRLLSPRSERINWRSLECKMKAQRKPLRFLRKDSFADESLWYIRANAKFLFHESASTLRISAAGRIRLSIHTSHNLFYLSAVTNSTQSLWATLMFL